MVKPNEMSPVERRECPCTHIVELAAGTAGEFKLLRSELEHTAGGVEERIKDTLDDFREMRLEIKGCLASMQESALMFNNGQHRFVKIETELIDIKAAAAAARLAAEKHKLEKIKARQEEETAYRKGIRRRFLLAEGVIVLVCLFLLRTHSIEAVAFISKVVLK